MLTIGTDGQVVTGLPTPMEYTLMVKATTDDDPPQFASDIVGPVTLTGETSAGRCNMQYQFSYKRQSYHNHCVMSYINWFNLYILRIKTCGSESKA